MLEETKKDLKFSFFISLSIWRMYGWMEEDLLPAMHEDSNSSIPCKHSLYIYLFFLFSGTGAGTQGLHLEPLHQPCFYEGFFEIGS
jgi:hypothetical protein